jgi:murein DD-endopeptidase MepM/ murein hydrolase activator NlpD
MIFKLFLLFTLFISVLEAKDIIYTVKSGDTLSSISKKYHIKLSKLKAYNKLKSNNIRIKQKIKIPTISTKKTKSIQNIKKNTKIKKITKDIQKNEQQLKKQATNKVRTSIKVKLLAKQIEKQTKELNQLDIDIKKINEDIQAH